MKNKNSDREKFFSKVSHDLRGSFTSILGFSNLLSDPNEDLSEEEILEFAQRIKVQSNESLELLVNFINLIKIQNYRALLHEEIIDITEILSESLNNLRKKFDDRSIKTVSKMNDGLTIRVDYEIFSAALNNILLFLIQICAEQSEMAFTADEKDEFIDLRISAICDDRYADALSEINIEDHDREDSIPVIFAAKFLGAMGGRLQISLDGEKILVIASIPRE